MNRLFVTSLLALITLMASAQTESDWISVELASPGSLGVEVLYKVNVLEDVQYLKVKGAMNNDDWTTVKNMANLKGADFSEAKFETVPKEQFYDRKEFHLINLPNGLKSIGNEAFRSTAIQSIDLPSSLTDLGNEAFRHCSSLESVTFNSANTNIGQDAFNSCSSLKNVSLPKNQTILNHGTFHYCASLASISLPATLQQIGSDCFSETSLTSIVFPDGLKTIGYYAFYDTKVEDIILPQGLTSLDYNVFDNCQHLKNIQLPISSTVYYNYTFHNCNNLEKVICPATTPPSTSNAFESVDLSKVTLTVPAFALVDYKLDTYWHQFGTIVGGAEPSAIDISGTLSLQNDRRPANKVDVTLNEGARLTVGGNSPFETGTLTFIENRYSDKGYGQLINNTSSMSADQIVTRYYIYRNRWYFITPLHDVNINDINHSDGEASFVFRYYNGQNRAANGPTGSWQDIIGTTLKAGQGYILNSDRDGWITMPSTNSGKAMALISSDAKTALTTYAAAEATDANWNYVGNPYPCHFDTYYMDLAAPITVWDEYNWTYRAYSPIDDNYVLKPMEAFFLQKPSGLSQILFRKEGRQMSEEVMRPVTVRKAAASNRQLFDIVISDGNTADKTRIVLNPQASANYEPECDAVKFFSTETETPQIYTIDQKGNQLSINEQPAPEGPVSLGILIAKPGTFTISLGRQSGTLLLTDTETNQTVDLSLVNYTFTANNTGNLNQRFTLTTNGQSTSINVITNNESAPGEAYDLQGRRIGQTPKAGIYVKNGKKIVVK